ncbi:MAG: hypothetical protein WCC11_00610 [Gammaproteobacteria bacterium]
MKKPVIITAVFAVIACSTVSYAQYKPSPLAEPSDNTIGYPTVAAARVALLARKDVNAYITGNGWLIVHSGPTVYSFTPMTDPAYPAVVKRTVVQERDGIYIDMTDLCEAKKEACDHLIKQFHKLNEKMRQYMKNQYMKNHGQRGQPPSLRVQS